jgi:hypothetical protein
MIILSMWMISLMIVIHKDMKKQKTDVYIVDS